MAIGIAIIFFKVVNENQQKLTFGTHDLHMGNTG